MTIFNLKQSWHILSASCNVKHFILLYLNINLGDVDDLVGKIKQNVKKINNIIDIANNESINFNDVINFSENIIDGKVNYSNKGKRYNEKFKNIEKNLENRTKETDASLHLCAPS